MAGRNRAFGGCLAQPNSPRSKDIDGFNGDVDTARILLDNIRVAQNNLGRGQHVGGGQPFVGLGKPAQAIPDGLGVIAATSELNTGFGFSFNASSM